MLIIVSIVKLALAMDRSCLPYVKDELMLYDVV
jgi:hypothetical protein